MANNMEKVKEWGVDNLTGILAIIAGLILVGITYKIILNMVIFTIGFGLIYFGVARLKIKKLTDFLDAVIAKFKSFFS